MEQIKKTYTVLMAKKTGENAGWWRVLGVCATRSAAETMVMENKAIDEPQREYRYKIKEEVK